jgi:hypothetical protein
MWKYNATKEFKCFKNRDSLKNLTAPLNPHYFITFVSGVVLLFTLSSWDMVVWITIFLGFVFWFFLYYDLIFMDFESK